MSQDKERELLAAQAEAAALREALSSFACPSCGRVVGEKHHGCGVCAPLQAAPSGTAGKAMASRREPLDNSDMELHDLAKRLRETESRLKAAVAILGNVAKLSTDPLMRTMAKQALDAAALAGAGGEKGVAP